MNYYHICKRNSTFYCFTVSRIDFLYFDRILCVLYFHWLARALNRNYSTVVVVFLIRCVPSSKINTMSALAVSHFLQSVGYAQKYIKKPFADWFTRCIFILSCLNLFKNNRKKSGENKELRVNVNIHACIRREHRRLSFWYDVINQCALFFEKKSVEISCFQYVALFLYTVHV